MSDASSSQSALEDAGWFVGRTVDVKPFLRSLNKNGYPIFPVVEAFLLAYGDLQIIYPYDDEGKMDELRIHPTFAIENISHSKVQDYCSRAGKALCPVGSYHWLHDTMMMAEDGLVYAGSSIYLEHIGLNWSGSYR